MAAVVGRRVPPQRPPETEISFADGVVFGENLLPVSHELWIIGGGIAQVQRTVELTSGEALELEIQCEAGTQRLFQVTGPEDAVWSLARLTLYDEDGLTQRDQLYAVSMGSTIQWGWNLSAGRFELVVSTYEKLTEQDLLNDPTLESDTGLTLRELLDYPTLEAEAEPRRFVLR